MLLVITMPMGYNPVGLQLLQFGFDDCLRSMKQLKRFHQNQVRLSRHTGARNEHQPRGPLLCQVSEVAAPFVRPAHRWRESHSKDTKIVGTYCKSTCWRTPSEAWRFAYWHRARSRACSHKESAKFIKGGGSQPQAVLVPATSMNFHGCDCSLHCRFKLTLYSNFFAYI